MPAIFVRTIRSPKRKKLISRIGKARQEIEKIIDGKIKNAAIQQMNKVVSNWKNKPDFVGSKFITQDKIEVFVEPVGSNAKFWIWTSRGTRPHLIIAKNAPFLVFRSKYDAKTKPGPPPTFGGSGKRSGSLIRKKAVNHPGTTPRHFEEQIAQQIQPRFRSEIENAFRRGVRRG